MEEDLLAHVGSHAVVEAALEVVEAVIAGRRIVRSRGIAGAVAIAFAAVLLMIEGVATKAASDEEEADDEGADAEESSCISHGQVSVVFVD
ncbi:MAG: hypothetical protein R3B09_08495 [Nannocystaceae bacterium]